MQRGQFTFYRSFWEAVQYLTPADRLSVLEGIARFALDGEEPELTDVGRAIFALVRPTLKTASKRAGGAIEEQRSRAAGNAGQRQAEGRPTSGQPQAEARSASGQPQADARSASGQLQAEARSASGQRQAEADKKEKEKETETETENEIEFENERENETETDHVRPCVAREWLPGLYVIDAPSEKEVREYCREIGSRIDSTKFLEYYAEREWKIDGVPIRNWKAVLRSWDDRELHGRAEGRETAWAG